MALWTPKRMGRVVTTRVLTFAAPGRRSRSVVVRVGLPVRKPKPVARDPWWTPLAVRGLGAHSLTTYIAGVDATQSLVLALGFLEEILPVQARRAGGSLKWVGKRSPLILREAPKRSKVRSRPGGGRESAG